MGTGDSVTDRGCARLPTTTISVSSNNWRVTVTLPWDCCTEISLIWKSSADTTTQ